MINATDIVICVGRFSPIRCSHKGICVQGADLKEFVQVVPLRGNSHNILGTTGHAVLQNNLDIAEVHRVVESSDDQPENQTDDQQSAGNIPNTAPQIFHGSVLPPVLFHVALQLLRAV